MNNKFFKADNEVGSNIDAIASWIMGIGIFLAVISIIGGMVAASYDASPLFFLQDYYMPE